MSTKTPYNMRKAQEEAARRDLLGKALRHHHTRLSEIIAALDRGEMTPEEASACAEWISASLRGTVKWFKSQTPPYES